SSPAPRSSSPCSRSTTSGMGCATPSTLEGCWRASGPSPTFASRRPGGGMGVSAPGPRSFDQPRGPSTEPRQSGPPLRRRAEATGPGTEPPIPHCPHASWTTLRLGTLGADRDLCFTPAAELVRLYRARKASPLEVMQAVLARIDAVNPKLNAYVTLT